MQITGSKKLIISSTVVFTMITSSLSAGGGANWWPVVVATVLYRHVRDWRERTQQIKSLRNNAFRSHKPC